MMSWQILECLILSALCSYCYFFLISLIFTFKVVKLETKIVIFFHQVFAVKHFDLN